MDDTRKTEQERWVELKAVQFEYFAVADKFLGDLEVKLGPVLKHVPPNEITEKADTVTSGPTELEDFLSSVSIRTRALIERIATITERVSPF